MHRHIRTAGFAAAGLSVALVLTGCGSSKSDDKPAAKSPSGSASTSAAPGGDGSPAKGSDLQGSWTATTGGKTVAMAIADKGVGLLSPHVCSGTVAEGAGMTMLTLKCADGNTERTQGMATLKGGNLEVKWEGGKTDSFTRGKTGSLPTGLPTAGLPTP
ncbi:hypothetical protein ACFYZ9_27820 [Streptomyces sp. NPDC001691]|uniref:hypothetical protein n=1 Tax=unclassified Streptomyces TaxID=2593676 RepID=UPI000DEA1286|nr:hypothetical protein [Streptomyces sp. SDr-06]RCH66073.1 hypothetical protein DT019_24990 [Streptomyces sp. SDr-06]